eukprot:11220305-Lingulodinium_polyedra.AAC.1
MVLRVPRFQPCHAVEQGAGLGAAHRRRSRVAAVQHGRVHGVGEPASRRGRGPRAARGVPEGRRR